MTVAEYIKQRLSLEEYPCSLEEIIDATSKNETSIKRELSRLIGKREVVNLRKGFYLILTPPLSAFNHRLVYILRNLIEFFS